MAPTSRVPSSRTIEASASRAFRVRACAAAARASPASETARVPLRRSRRPGGRAAARPGPSIATGESNRGAEPSAAVAGTVAPSATAAVVTPAASAAPSRRRPASPGSTRDARSSVSTNPGSTVLPAPSIVCASAGGVTWRPTAVMRPPENTIVPTNGSLPDPSMMRAPVMAIGGRPCACGRASSSATATSIAAVTPNPRATRLSGPRSFMRALYEAAAASHVSNGSISTGISSVVGQRSPHSACRAAR
jgi:hypothetical protein